MKKLFLLYLPILAFSFLFIACNSDDEEENTSALYYFTAIIDGQTISVEDGQGNLGNGAGSGGSTISGGWQEQQSMIIQDVWNDYPSYSIEFVKAFPNSWEQDCVDFHQMITMGNHEFGSYESTDYPNGLNGVIITIIEADGEFWTSSLSHGDQSGSSLQIIEHTANGGQFSENKSKAIFNCILYNVDGDSRVLTNGEMRSRSVQCGA